MILYFLCLLLLVIFVYRFKEPYEGSPYEYAQSQAGEIQNLHDKLQKITLTDALLDSLQSDTDQTTDQIYQLQTNMPNKTKNY